MTKVSLVLALRAAAAALGRGAHDAARQDIQLGPPGRARRPTPAVAAHRAAPEPACCECSTSCSLALPLTRRRLAPRDGDPATPQSARCPTTAGGRTPFARLHHRRAPSGWADADAWRPILRARRRRPRFSQRASVSCRCSRRQCVASGDRDVQAPGLRIEAAARTPNPKKSEDDLVHMETGAARWLVARDVGGRRPSCSSRPSCSNVGLHRRADGRFCRRACASPSSLVPSPAARSQAWLMPRLSMSVIARRSSGRRPGAAGTFDLGMSNIAAVRAQRLCAGRRDPVPPSQQRRLARKGPERAG